jgi:hypothetical protein
MDTKKFFIGTLAGGVTFFFVGYLIFGIALVSFYSDHTVASTSGMRTMDDMVWWALILGNFASGAMLTYFLLKAHIVSFGQGASAASVIGFLMWLSFDMIRYATEGVFDLTAYATDIVAATVMTAIAGGVIGAVLGIGIKK